MFKKVVIIDDNQTQLKILKSHFVAREWEVFCAKSVVEGLTLVYSNAPDLIITDAIMPKIGGFQLLKQLREDAVLKKIPVIVYSVLTYNLARLYIKEGTGEYFATKNDNPEEILDLATKAVEDNPLSQKDKIAILNKNAQEKEQESIVNSQIENIIEKHNEKEEFVFEIEPQKLYSLLKNSYSVLMNDEKMPNELFSILRPLLFYDLALVCFYDFLNKKQQLCFDVQNFIFNPILQNYFTTECACNNVKINKKLAPNSKTITSVDEFNSKIELTFKYQQSVIARMNFYSRREKIWENQENVDTLQSILNNFFIDRFINKNSQDIKKTTFSKYLKNEMDLNLKNNFNPTKTKIGMYIGIVSITNYHELETYSYEEDMDVLNLKISESIVRSVTEGEQIGKLKENEYALIVLADDDFQAQMKFSALIDTLSKISINEEKLNISIGISNCYINGIFDIQEAEKRAYTVLESITEINKAVIYAK